MNRDDIICDIESLFPIDSEYSGTNEVGKRLLMQAIEQTGWRELPDHVLEVYRLLCMHEDNRQNFAK